MLLTMAGIVLTGQAGLRINYLTNKKETQHLHVLRFFFQTKY